MAVLRQNVHRRGRRRLTRGQYPSAPTTTVAVSSTGTTNLTMTFAVPVIASYPIPTTVAGLTLVSQTQTSPTVVSQTWSGNVSAKAWVFPGNTAAVLTYQGGGVAGSAGTFS